MLYPRSVPTCLAILAGAILAVSAARAHTIWHVDDDAPGDPGPGDPTISDPNEDGSVDRPFDAIQEAIDGAQEGDEVLVADGTYTGGDNKNLDFGAKAITVRSANGPTHCIIDCEGEGRGFYFHSGETSDALVEGFTIQNADNAGIYCSWSSPTISGCVIAGNRRSGVRCSDCRDLTIIDSTFVANGRYGHTGGIDCEEQCHVTISGCIITGSGGAGITADWSCTATVTNCAIVGNRCGGVGSGKLTLGNCLVAGNNLGCDEYSASGAVAAANPTIVNCTIANNQLYQSISAVRCGAPGTTTTIANSVIWGNADPNEPEIIFGSRWMPRQAILTVSYTDVQGGLGDVEALSENTVLKWNPGNLNTDPLFVGGPSGTWTADAVGDPDAFQMTFTDADAAWSDSELVGRLIDADLQSGLQRPIVANTANTITVWADSTQVSSHYAEAGHEYQVYDYRLTPDSPCVDAGCNCAVLPDLADLDDDGDTAEYTPFDLDGEGRFFDDPVTEDSGSGLPPVVDMGAFEFGGSDPQPCFGDLDGDHDADSADLIVLLENYGIAEGAGGAEGDFDCDGNVDLSDLAALLGVYGRICE